MLVLKDFLKKEVKPALGCTDPGAVALAVARACKELPDKDSIASIRVTVSDSIYKNGMAVVIPGTRGARGNAMAAAGQKICIPQGVVGASIEEKVENIAKVTREGMKNVDRLIIEILDHCHRPAAENF